VEALPPLTVAAARFLIASALLWGWAGLQAGTGRRIERSDLPVILLMGASAIAVYNVLFLYGLRLAPASDGAIIVPGLAPAFTVLVAWPTLRERVGGRQIAGFVAAAVGLSLVMRPSGETSAARLLGNVLFVLGALCWGFYTVASRVATRRFSAVSITLYATVAGTAMLVPFSVAERGWRALAAAPASAWGGLLFLATFGTVFAFVLFSEGVQRIGAGPASAFAFLVPIVGVVSSVVILDETLNLPMIAGSILVLLGLWLVQRPAPAAKPG
jgi:drug/metabolite transporter (DMT)-like permease